jgi:hypothetical protein
MIPPNSFPDDATVQNLISQLTPDERERGVAYLYASVILEGTRLNYPRISIEVSWPKAGLAFVDREPLANWSHSSRYILINLETGFVHSYEASLPPFQPAQSSAWRLLYKAPGVPEAAVMVKSP